MSRAGGYWQRVLAADMAVPADRPLAELVGELVGLLGSPAAALRDETAYPVLATWIERGACDGLLVGLGDELVAALGPGPGGRGSDAVFRRSFSALVLAECVERDTAARVLPDGTVARWCGAVTAWLLGEDDLRGFVPGKGWAHALAHGADAIGCLARSPHLGGDDLAALLDVLADRARSAPPSVLVSGEADRLAAAALEVLRRDQLSADVVEPWVARLADAATHAAGAAERDPFLATGGAEALLRALYLQVALGDRPPAIAAHLRALLEAALRRTNPHHLGTAPPV